MKVLFVGHSAGLTGAPKSFLLIIKHLVSNYKVKGFLLLRETGPLVKDYSDWVEVKHHIPTRFYGSKRKLIFGTILKKIGLKLYWWKLKKQITEFNPDLIYSNTIINQNALNWLSFLNVPVITHVRELESSINFYGGAPLVKFMDQKTNLFITVSNAVKELLMNTYQIRSEKIEVIHNFADLNDFDKVEDIKPLFFEKHHLPANAFIVGSSGGILWRKGPDLFVQLAAQMKKSNPDLPIYFVWLGAEDSPFLTDLKYDLRQLGLTNIIFLPLTDQPYPIYKIFDVFALMSRDEPYARTVMEVAMLEKPILCFEKSGGIPEFVEEDAGEIVPYLDLNILAKKIIELYENRNLLDRKGKRAKEKLISEFSLTAQMNKIHSICRQQLN